MAYSWRYDGPPWFGWSMQNLGGATLWDLLMLVIVNLVQRPLCLAIVLCTILIAGHEIFFRPSAGTPAKDSTAGNCVLPKGRCEPEMLVMLDPPDDVEYITRAPVRVDMEEKAAEAAVLVANPDNVEPEETGAGRKNLVRQETASILTSEIFK